MKESKKEFSYVQFIGDNSHFLMDMKGKPENETLKETNKYSNVDEYFKR